MPTRTMGERLDEALARIKELERENEALRQQLAQAEDEIEKGFREVEVLSPGWERFTRHEQN